MRSLVQELDAPVILANKVSSLPRPTFRPGFTRVPRCRTMIVPPGTTCPPNALNPSRCAFESRPFRELPCPFLCAISFPRKRSAGVTAGCREGFRPQSLISSWPPSSRPFLGAAFLLRSLLWLWACRVPQASAFTFFGFASFFGSSGALKLCPSKAISAIRTAV